MRLWILSAGLLLLAACFSHSAVMTRGSYDDIGIGTSISEVTAKIGEPYAIHTKSDGTQEYEYIEKINLSGELVAENHYFLLVRGGQVVGKREKSEKPPAYDLIYQCDPNFTH